MNIHLEYVVPEGTEPGEAVEAAHLWVQARVANAMDDVQADLMEAGYQDVGVDIDAAIMMRSSSLLKDKVENITGGNHADV